MWGLVPIAPFRALLGVFIAVLYVFIWLCMGSRAPTVEEKIALSLNIYKISSKDLGAVVDMLEEQCPKALDKVSAL